VQWVSGLRQTQDNHPPDHTCPPPREAQVVHTVMPENEGIERHNIADKDPAGITGGVPCLSCAQAVKHRELKIRAFMASLNTTTWLTGRVLVLVFTATAFGFLLTSYKIPNEIAAWVLGFTNNVYLVWTFVVIFLLFLGMFMETLAIIMLVTPVLLPIMTAYGVDPIHFGLVLICCCGIGFSTPPLGANMFISSGISNQSLERISLKALPMVATSSGSLP